MNNPSTITSLVSARRFAEKARRRGDTALADAYDERAQQLEASTPAAPVMAAAATPPAPNLWDSIVARLNSGSDPEQPNVSSTAAWGRVIALYNDNAEVGAISALATLQQEAQ